MLLEREGEVAALRDVLESARAGVGRVALVEAGPGLGKSSLLDHVRPAAADGIRMRSVRCSELEKPFAFGAVRGLLEPLLVQLSPQQRDSAFAGAAAAAARVFEPEGSELPALGAFPVLHGLHWLCVNLSAQTPLALMIDDAHWADDASLGWLAFVAARMEDARLALLVAARPSDRAPLAEVARLAQPRLGLRPLSAAATVELITRELPAQLPPDLLHACHAATGGNPLYLLEIVRTLAAEGVSATGSAAPLDLRTIGRGVLARLGREGPEAVAVARAVSVLGEVGLGTVARFCELDLERVVEVAERLAEVAVLVADRPLRFLHPVLRAAVYEDMTPARRAAAHARVARLRYEEGAAPDAVATHLLRCDPVGERWAARVLEAAAADALRRGSPTDAATFLERALREPTAAARRWSLLWNLGQAMVASGGPSAERALAEAAREAPDTVSRARITLDHAAAILAAHRPQDAFRAAEEVMAALPEDERELRLRLESMLLATAHLGGGNLYPALHDRAARARDLAGNSPGERLVLASVAYWMSITAQRAADAAAVARRALGEGRLLEEQTPETPPYAWAVLGLLADDCIEEAGAAFDAYLELARRRGSPFSVAIGSVSRCAMHHRTGDVRALEADASTALEASKTAGWVVGSVGALRYLVAVQLEQGDLDAAESTLISAGMHGEIPDLSLFSLYLFDRGRLRLAQGRPEDALADLDELARREKRDGIAHPGSPWRLAAAAAHTALGDRERARSVATEELELACQRETNRRILGQALHALAMTHDREERIERLREAVAMLASGAGRLAEAKAWFDLGLALRHGNRRADAREPLERAMELGYRCGARGLESRAREELKILGARPRRPVTSGVDSLTASERRVAELAAQGLSNPEIAQSLFVTRKTVEMHLGRVYRKLGMSDRERLPEILR